MSLCSSACSFLVFFFFSSRGRCTMASLVRGGGGGVEAYGPGGGGAVPPPSPSVCRPTLRHLPTALTGLRMSAPDRIQANTTPRLILRCTGPSLHVHKWTLRNFRTVDFLGFELPITWAPPPLCQILDPRLKLDRELEAWNLLRHDRNARGSGVAYSGGYMDFGFHPLVQD